MADDDFSPRVTPPEPGGGDGRLVALVLAGIAIGVLILLAVLVFVALR